MLADVKINRCFDSAKTKIKVGLPQIRTRKCNFFRIASFGKLINDIAAWVTQTKQFRDLVKCLTRRIIACRNNFV